MEKNINSNRTFYTPIDLMKKVIQVCKKIGTNPNNAHVEGLKLWLKKNDK